MGKKRYEPTHKHKCAYCGTVWEHSYRAINRDEYHRCPNPKCGREEWRPYEGDEPASVVQKVVPLQK
jgi:predicted  nucleic acid-binding Zn-ribbon protein